MSSRPDSNALTIIGLMSGTSVDAVDACAARLCRDAAGRFGHEVLATHTQEIPAALRQRLLAVMGDVSAPVREICTLNVAVGELFGQTVLDLLKSSGLRADNIDVIGSHGQTIYHIPPTGSQPGSTLQIGEPGVIAEMTGIQTVADFRPRDMAAGGHGAPLVCLADQLLFQTADRGRCVQNIGGIANVTVLPPQGSAEIRAFDTGPGNMLIDGAMTQLFGLPYDANGAVAASGQVNESILSELLAHPYFELQPPKTTGRELFGQAFLAGFLELYGAQLAPKDIVATLTALSAHSIAAAYARFVFPRHEVAEVIVGGGGVYNTTLMRQLEALLKTHQPGIRVCTHDDFGVHNKYKEALAFAILAWATLNGLPGNIPSCTGARHPVVLGKITR